MQLRYGGRLFWSPAASKALLPKSTGSYSAYKRWNYIELQATKNTRKSAGKNFFKL